MAKRPARRQTSTPTLPLSGSFPHYLSAIARDLSRRYAFGGEAGRGKTGAAYKIVDVHTDRPFCLKTCSPDVTDAAGREQVRETLSTEVKILRPLSHRCLPAIYDAQLKAELPYYVCTYHPGVTFKRFRLEGRKLPLRESTSAIWSLLDVMKYLHNQDRQHCDLHSENVMISPEVFRDGIMVIDFSSGHRGSDSSPDTFNRGNFAFKPVSDQPQAGRRVTRKVTQFEQYDFAGLGMLLAQMKDSFFAGASRQSQSAYVDFCGALRNGDINTWDAIEDRFLTVLDPYRIWTGNADLFTSADGGPQAISLPAGVGVAVGVAPLAVVNTSAFQRLRGIRQLSFCEWFFPGASHTRFEHSLGVFGRAKSAIESLVHDRAFRDLRSVAQIRGFLLAALVHDVGHYPFGHLVEQYAASRLWKSAAAKEAASHSRHSLWLMDNDEELRTAIDEHWGPEARLNARRTLTKQVPVLSELLDGPIDIDKVDYLARDAVHCGVPFGAGLDVSGLHRALRVVHGGHRLGIESAGVPAAEGLMVLQDQMLSSVYWHPTIRGLICMFHGVLANLVSKDEALFNGLVEELKRCTSEDDAIRSVLRPRVDMLPKKKRESVQRLLSPLVRLKFSDIYVPTVTYAPTDPPPEHLPSDNAYRSIVKDFTHTESTAAEPVNWHNVRRLRTAYIAALIEMGQPADDLHVVIDVPYGKSSRQNLIVYSDRTGVEKDITDISHLKETIFTMPATFLSPVRVYLAPEMHAPVSERISRLRQRAEEIFYERRPLNDHADE
ncbi:MAG TPA: protein kinase [Tepidisphaeraceae bacterium]|jgi:hypothetical protein|nr:protein kinase [Tepidisphaeraceae bacterium]